MVNQHHALIFNEKKGETIVGLFIFYNYLVKVEVA